MCTDENVMCSVSPFPEPSSEKKHSAPDTGAEWCGNSSDEKPSDEKIRASLTDVREEIERARRLVRSPENAFTCALGALSALERRIVALEKKSRETAKSPEKDQSVAQKISELRESLGDESPRETESSSSKEEEHFLVAPIKEVSEDGRLLLGDRKILSAKALKI